MKVEITSGRNNTYLYKNQLSRRGFFYNADSGRWQKENVPSEKIMELITFCKKTDSKYTFMNLHTVDRRIIENNI